MYQENKENAHSIKKTPKASRALRWVLEPGLLKLTLFARLHFAPSTNFPITILVAPEQNPGSTTV